MAKEIPVVLSEEQKAALVLLLVEVGQLMELMPAGWHDIHPMGMVEAKIPLARLRRLVAIYWKARDVFREIFYEAARRARE